MHSCENVITEVLTKKIGLNIEENNLSKLVYKLHFFKFVKQYKLIVKLYVLKNNYTFSKTSFKNDNNCENENLKFHIIITSKT